MKKTNVQVENLINWRQLSKTISKSGSETSIRMNDCPKKYNDKVEALLIAIQKWYSEHIRGTKPELKYTVKEIKDKLDSIEW